MPLYLHLLGTFVRVKGFEFIKCANFLKGRVLTEYQKLLWPCEAKANM